MLRFGRCRGELRLQEIAADGILDHLQGWSSELLSLRALFPSLLSPGVTLLLLLHAYDMQTYLKGVYFVVVVVYLQEQYQSAEMSSINRTHYFSTWTWCHPNTSAGGMIPRNCWAQVFTCGCWGDRTAKSFSFLLENGKIPFC